MFFAPVTSNLKSPACLSRIYVNFVLDIYIYFFSLCILNLMYLLCNKSTDDAKLQRSELCGVYIQKLWCSESNKNFRFVSLILMTLVLIKKLRVEFCKQSFFSETLIMFHWITSIYMPRCQWHLNGHYALMLLLNWKTETINACRSAKEFISNKAFHWFDIR